MKLLFLTVMPSPYQRQLLSRLAESEDIEVTVRYFTIGAHDREWRSPDFQPHERAMPGKVIHQLGPSAHWNSSVIDEIKSVDADLVVVSDYSALTAQYAMRWLARKRKPFIFWGEVPGFSKRGPIGTYVRQKLQAPLAKASGIAAIGSRAEEAYKSLFPKVPTFNIPYFCDLSPYRDARASRKDRTNENITLLFSGQLIYRKGPDLLIEAFISAANEIPELKLKIIGNGPDIDRLNSMIPDEYRRRVEFLGHKEPAELPGLFAAADIFCLPSRHDGWGVVVNEALGAALPIIATDSVGAALDLVEDGRNGLIVPTDDARSLANALRKLADSNLRNQMSDHASHIAERWDLSEGVERWRIAALQVLDQSSER